MSRLVDPKTKSYEHEDLVLASLFIQFHPSEGEDHPLYIALKTFSIKHTTDIFLEEFPYGDAHEYIGFLIRNKYIKALVVDLRLFEAEE